MSEKIVQTAGRDQLGEFAPEFAHFNDDVLFGENWNNEDINLKTRSIITIVALMSSGITDSSLIYHLQNAKKHGVTKKEIVAIITHVAFYVGWPKGWAVFSLAKDVWKETADKNDAKAQHQASMIFPMGKPNDAFAKYFVGQSYLAPISMKQVGVFNVTFEPGCRNNWHIHHADKDVNKATFDDLYKYKVEIESKLGTELQWNRGDDIKSSKVFIQLDNVSIENEDDWPQMAKFHADWTKKFYDVIVPYIKG